MEGLEIEAVYENGVLKLPRELPLVEGATVTITIHPPRRPGVIKHVQFHWTGTREDLEQLAESDDNHPREGGREEFDRWLADPDEGQWGPRDV
jgi:predicted DNA-binding antitoxin AbrB/MazE fold protein